MTDTAYYKLREFLDQFPIGYPETDSGVEIKILKKLFTQDEAQTAVLLSPFPEEVEKIAVRNNQDADELRMKLESMSLKGLVFRSRRDGNTLYNTAPFMIGLYEYSVDIIDEELAGLFREYYDTAFLTELGISNVPGFKVIPIEENIEPNQVLLPHHTLEEKIRASRKISVAECICRKETRLIDEACDYPLETCLSFGVAAEYYIENGIGREIDADEAIRILNEADKAGLVHAGSNSKHLSNICNCCPCCCASMKGITNLGHDKRKYMNALYEALVNPQECTLCEDCINRCPVGAITLTDEIQINRQKCLGCGLCAGVCPSESISIYLREDREEPYDKVSDMGMAILEAKQRNTLKQSEKKNTE
ncbi:4Fe-4S binding protein [bacterium]|nr:4Fe-4S binding protein [bacterium]